MLLRRMLLNYTIQLIQRICLLVYIYLSKLAYIQLLSSISYTNVYIILSFFLSFILSSTLSLYNKPYIISSTKLLQYYLKIEDLYSKFLSLFLFYLNCRTKLCSSAILRETEVITLDNTPKKLSRGILIPTRP